MLKVGSDNTLRTPERLNFEAVNPKLTEVNIETGENSQLGPLYGAVH